MAIGKIQRDPTTGKVKRDTNGKAVRNNDTSAACCCGPSTCYELVDCADDSLSGIIVCNPPYLPISYLIDNACYYLPETPTSADPPATALIIDNYPDCDTCDANTKRCWQTVRWRYICADYAWEQLAAEDGDIFCDYPENVTENTWVKYYSDESECRYTITTGSNTKCDADGDCTEATFDDPWDGDITPPGTCVCPDTDDCGFAECSGTADTGVCLHPSAILTASWSGVSCSTTEFVPFPASGSYQMRYDAPYWRVTFGDFTISFSPGSGAIFIEVALGICTELIGCGIGATATRCAFAYRLDNPPTGGGSGCSNCTGTITITVADPGCCGIEEGFCSDDVSLCGECPP